MPVLLNLPHLDGCQLKLNLERPHLCDYGGVKWRMNCSYPNSTLETTECAVNAFAGATTALTTKLCLREPGRSVDSPRTQP